MLPQRFALSGPIQPRSIIVVWLVQISGTLHRPKLLPSVDEAHRGIDEPLGGAPALLCSRLTRIALAPDPSLRHVGRCCFLACLSALESFGQKHHRCGAIARSNLWKHAREMRWERQRRLRGLVEINQGRKKIERA